jgi:hypothetical protein
MFLGKSADQQCLEVHGHAVFSLKTQHALPLKPTLSHFAVLWLQSSYNKPLLAHFQLIKSCKLYLEDNKENAFSDKANNASCRR